MSGIKSDLPNMPSYIYLQDSSWKCELSLCKERQVSGGDSEASKAKLKEILKKL